MMKSELWEKEMEKEREREGMVRESGEMDFHAGFEASSCFPFFS